jgi:hypothetical protein
LAETRQVTAILRLMVDRNGHLLHGEVVNVEDNSQNRFKDWAGLTRTLRVWLASQFQGDTPDQPRS